MAACGSVPALRFDDEIADGGAEGGDAARSGPCVPSGVEICDDGIDTTVTGRSTAPTITAARTRAPSPPPADWALVALAQAARPSCPAGFGESRDVRAVQGDSGVTACAYDCGGGSACAPAGVLAAFDSGPACNAATMTFQVRTQCTRVNGAGIAVDANAFTRGTAGVAASCNATPPGTVVPVKDGRTCAVPRVGGGCTNGQVCVPRTSDAFGLCVTRAGSVTCPGSFPSAHRMGTEAKDSRGCTKCTCTAVPSTGEVKLYDGKDCSGGEKMTLVATPPPCSCSQETNGAFQARGYVATVSGGCGTKTAPLASGALVLTDEATFCGK